MLPSSVGVLPSQRASIRSVCLRQICNPNLNRLSALALHPSPTSSQLLFSLFAYPSFQTLHSLPSARDVWWRHPGQDKCVTFRKQERIPSPRFPLVSPFVTRDWNCFYFVLWHRRRKTGHSPRCPQVRLLSQRAFKTCDSSWQMSTGLLLPTSPYAWGMTPFSRMACAHTFAVTRLVCEWQRGSRFSSCFTMMHIACVLGTVHYREQLNDAACLYVYWPVEMKTRQNMKNVYELLMSVKCSISLSSYSLASLFILTSSRFIVWAQVSATFSLLLVLNHYVVCPRHVLSVQTAESPLCRGGQPDSHTCSHSNWRHIIQRWPQWRLIDRQLVMTRLPCVSFLIKIQSDSEKLKVV